MYGTKKQIHFHLFASISHLKISDGSTKVTIKVTRSNILVSMDRSYHKEYICHISKSLIAEVKVVVTDGSTDGGTDRQTKGDFMPCTFMKVGDKNVKVNDGLTIDG